MGNSNRRSDKLYIVINYCGSQGNDSLYNNLRYFLEEQNFSDRIQIVGRRDFFVTGRFEVTVKETKETIHSKKAGMGWPTTPQKKKAICVKICEALLARDKKRDLKGKRFGGTTECLQKRSSLADNNAKPVVVSRF